MQVIAKCWQKENYSNNNNNNTIIIRKEEIISKKCISSINLQQWVNHRILYLVKVIIVQVRKTMGPTAKQQTNTINLILKWILSVWKEIHRKISPKTPLVKVRVPLQQVLSISLPQNILTKKWTIVIREVSLLQVLKVNSTNIVGVCRTLMLRKEEVIRWW